MAIDSTPLGELLLKKRRGVLSPFEDSELRSSVQGAAKKLLLQYPETSKTKLRRSSAEKTLAKRVSSGAFPNLKPLILTEGFDVFPRQRISIWLAMDLSEHANTDNLSDDLKRSLGPILEPTSPNWELCALETASNCLAATLLAGLPDRSEDEIKWWQPDYLSVPLRQILGIKHRLFDVLTALRYYPAELIAIVVGNTVRLTSETSPIPNQIIIETCKQISKSIKWELRRFLIRNLGDKLEIGSVTEKFWTHFGAQIFETFLQGIRGRDKLFGIGVKKEIYTLEYLKVAANCFFRKYDELRKYVELDLGVSRRKINSQELEDFKKVSDLALKEMLIENVDHCRLELEPTHDLVRNFAYCDQMCFVVSPYLPKADGEVLSIDDPCFQIVLGRQEKIPRYSAILARDSRNLITDGKKRHLPIKRKHVKKLYWPLLKDSGKKIPRRVLRDVLPYWTITPIPGVEQEHVPKNRGSAQLPSISKLTPDNIRDCIETIEVYIEALKVELIDAPRGLMGGGYAEKINYLFERSRKYIFEKYYSKSSSEEFFEIINFYKTKKDEIIKEYEFELDSEKLCNSDNANGDDENGLDPDLESGGWNSDTFGTDLN